MALFGRPPAPAPLSRLEELKRLVAKEPASRQFLSLAEEYRKTGKFIDVVQTLQAGLQYNQSYVAAWVALGRAQHQIGKIDEAIRGYGEALRLDPHNLVAVRQLAELHLQKGDKVEAIKKFKLFRGLSPGDRGVNETIEQLEIDLKAERALKAPRVETWPNLVPPKPPAPKTPEPAIRTSPITAPVERPVVPPLAAPAAAPGVPPVAPPRPPTTAQPEPGWRAPQEPRPMPLTQSGAFRMPLAAPAAGTTGRIVPPPLPPRLESLVRATPPPAPLAASPAPGPDPVPAAPSPAPQPAKPPVAAYAPVPPPQAPGVAVPLVPAAPPAPPPKAKASDLLELTFDGTSGRTTGPIPRAPSLEAPTLPPPAPPPPSWAPAPAPEPSDGQPPVAAESRVVTAPVPPPAPEPAVAREPAPPPRIEVAPAPPPHPPRTVETAAREGSAEVPPRAAPVADDVFGMGASAAAETPSPGPDRPQEAAPFDEPATAPIPPPLEVPPPPAAPVPPSSLASTPAPAVTETLASLYEAQGYAGDAAAAYESLAATAPDPERARELTGKAERARTKPAVNGTVRARLEAFAAKLPVPPEARLEDLGAVLRRLRGRVPGIQAAAVTDLEGLPVVVSEDADEAALEALIAELTAFWKSVLRRRDDVGTGALSALTLQARDGVALVSLVSPEYSLIVRTGRDVPIGQVRYEAERAAALLRPALA